MRFALALAAAMTAAGIVSPRAYGADLIAAAPHPAPPRSAASASVSPPIPASAGAGAAVIEYVPDATVSVLPGDIDFVDLDLGQADFPPLGYVFEGSFFHRDACEAAGASGVPRAWPGYVCLGGDVPWEFSDLYVRDFG